MHGLSVTDLARAVGVSHTYVSLVEGKQTKASPRYQAAAAPLLGVPIDLLFDTEGWAR